MNGGRMGGFWDRRARENPWYFVDNRVDYRDPDTDRFWAEGEPTVADILERLDLAVSPSATVVEIGCGVGRLTRALAARARHVMALDVSDEMLALARRHNPALANVTWLRGDGVSLSGIDDASADGCFSHVVFQHIPDPHVTLGYVREMGRVLRAGGWAAFGVSNDPAVHEGDSPLRSRLGALLRRAPAGQTRPEWLGSSVALSELRAVANEAGMEVERVVGEGTQFCLVRTRKRGG